MNWRVLIFCVTLSAVFCAQAEQLYPELLVQPKTSERIKSEAKVEADNNWKNFWPIEASALVTFAAGATQALNASIGYTPWTANNGSLWASGAAPSKNGSSPSDVAAAAYTAEGVGLIWFGVAYYLSRNYMPFTTADKELSAMPSSTPAEQLTKERYAEEKLDSAVRMGRVLDWSYAVSNALICQNLSTYANGASNIMGMVCLVDSLLPVLVNTTWHSVKSYQEDYRKKIYGPIASMTLMPSTVTPGALTPGVAVSWQF